MYVLQFNDIHDQLQTHGGNGVSGVYIRVKLQLQFCKSRAALSSLFGSHFWLPCSLELRLWLSLRRPLVSSGWPLAVSSAAIGHLKSVH